ncbi:MAG: hypothetical protein ACXWX5_11455 [Actinomycetota bacterium]
MSTPDDVQTYISGVSSPTRQRDARTMLELIQMVESIRIDPW